MPKIEETLGLVHGKYTADDLLKGVLATTLLLFASEKALALCSVEPTPQMRTFVIFFGVTTAQGDGSAALKEMYPEAEQVARHLKCSLIQISGRTGWIRELGELGFKRSSVILTKVLDDG